MEDIILEEDEPIEVRPEVPVGDKGRFLSPFEGDDDTPSSSRIISEHPGYAPSVASSTRSNHSQFTTNPLRPTTEKRRSMRLARRSSGGETALPVYEDLRDGMLDETPTVETVRRAFP